MLDSRAPPTQIAEEEKQRDETLEAEIKRLCDETRMWRVANSAQWVAWGIVQAKVPGMDEALEAQKTRTPKPEDPADRRVEDEQPLIDQKGPDDLEAARDATNKQAHNYDEAVPAERSKGEEEGEEDDEEEFDYLAYAQERAMLFWGDILQLGIVKREELPQELLEKVKIVEY